MGWRAGFRAGVRAQLSGLTPAAPCTDGIPPSLAHACGYSSRSSRSVSLPSRAYAATAHRPPVTAHARKATRSAAGHRHVPATRRTDGACVADSLQCSGCARRRAKAIGQETAGGKPARIGYRETGKRAPRARPRGSEYARPCSLRGRAANRPTADTSRHEPTQAVTARRATQPARPASPSASTHRPARRSQATRHRRERRRPPPSFTPASRRRARQPPASALRAPASPRQWRRRGRDGDDCRNPTDGSPA